MASFEEMYPHIANWIDEWGWIEIGNDSMSTSLIRALKALDEALGKWFTENL